MYLNYLNNDQKRGFIQLAMIMANADGKYCENEKLIMGSYLNETELAPAELVDEQSIEDITKNFSDSISQKIVILELFSMMKIDGEVDDSEKEVLDQLINIFKIDPQFLENADLWTKAMQEIIQQGYSLIHS